MRKRPMKRIYRWGVVSSCKQPLLSISITEAEEVNLEVSGDELEAGETDADELDEVEPLFEAAEEEVF